MRILFFIWALQGFAAFNLTWGMPAVGLDSNPPVGDTDANATIAIDPRGNAVAAWSRTTGRGANEHIWAAVYNHSLRVWTGAVKISGGGSASNPQVALDSEGNGLLVWEEGFPSQIFTRFLSSTGVWMPDLSAPPLFARKSKNPQTTPQICIDGEGNALLMWVELSQGKKGIYSARKGAKEGSWTDLGEVSRSERNCSLVPFKSLALNRKGNGIAVWEEKGGLSSQIHGALYAHGRWLSSIEIAAQSGKEVESPSAAIDDFGNGVIVWNEEGAILSKTVTQGAFSLEPVPVCNGSYIAKRPHVQVDGEGNAIVVFEMYDAMHKFIGGACLPRGKTIWESPIHISGPSPADVSAAGYPVFAMNRIGDGVAIWKEWTGSNMIIQGSGYSLGTWSPIKTLSALNADSGALFPSYDISVALNEAGNILAIWPEDPNQTKAQQIKTTATQGIKEELGAQIESEKPIQQIKGTVGMGLANTGPLPPMPHPATVSNGIILGKQKARRFPGHIDLFNVLSWLSPENIAYFNIYRGNFSSLIGSVEKPGFEDHQRNPDKKEIYLITSVDSNGQESGPMTIVVHPARS